MKVPTNNQLIHTSTGQNFLMNLGNLGMQKEDLGKMFKNGDGVWCYFTGVNARNWKRPMLYTTIHGVNYKITIAGMKKLMEKAIVVSGDTHPDLV